MKQHITTMNTVIPHNTDSVNTVCKLTTKDVAMLFGYREELREHAATERQFARHNKVCPDDLSALAHEHQARHYLNDARTITVILHAIIRHGMVKVPRELMDALHSL